MVWQVGSVELFLPCVSDSLSDCVQSLWPPQSDPECTPASVCSQLQAVWLCPAASGNNQCSQPSGTPLTLTHSSSFKEGTQCFFSLALTDWKFSRMSVKLCFIFSSWCARTQVRADSKKWTNSHAKLVWFLMSTNQPVLVQLFN